MLHPGFPYFSNARIGFKPRNLPYGRQSFKRIVKIILVSSVAPPDQAARLQALSHNQ